MYRFNHCGCIWNK